MVKMITIKDIEEYGNGLKEVIGFIEDDQTLWYEISQDTMKEVAERFQHSAKQYGETGLEYAYMNISRGDYTTLWDVVGLLNPELTEGSKESIYDFKHRHHLLAELILIGMDWFSEQLMSRIQSDK